MKVNGNRCSAPGSDKQDFSNSEFVEGIKYWHKPVIDFLYKNFLPSAIKNICRNNPEGEDVFHNLLIDLNKKFNEKNFAVNTKFRYFFMDVFRKKWLNILRKNKYEIPADNFSLQKLCRICSGSPADLLEKKEKCAILNKVFRHHFGRLDAEYRKIISMRLDEFSFNEIAKKLGYKNEQQVINRHNYSMNLLADNMRNDPRLKEYL